MLDFFMVSKKVLVISLLCLLAGCKPGLTPDYLMSHPSALEKELARCNLSQEETQYCTDIKELAHEFVLLSNERALNPEGFGKTVLREEAALVHLEIQLSDAKKQYYLKKTSENQQKMLALEKKYQAASKKVKTLLNIIAATSSPES